MTIPTLFEYKRLIYPASFLFLFFIVLPFTVYFHNMEEFQFSLERILSEYSYHILFSVFALFIPYIINKKAALILSNVCLLLICYLFVVIFFIPIQSRVFDGAEVNPVLIFSINIQYYLSFGIISLILSLFMIAEKLLKDIVAFALGISVLWVAYISYEVYQANRFFDETSGASNVDFANSVADFASLSKDQNILIFSFDGIPGGVVSELLDEEPEFYDLFDGFTYYKDTAAVAPHTSISLTTTLLGYIPASDSTLSEMIEKSAHISLLSELYNEGYDVSFSGTSRTKNKILTTRTGLPRLSVASSSSLMELGQACIARMLPAAIGELYLNIKSVFLYKMFILLYAYNKVESQASSMLNDPFGSTCVHKIDYFFVDEYIKQMKVNNDRKTAQFYHFIFTHQPLNFDRSCRYHLTDTVPQNYDSSKYQVYCALKVMARLVAKLKKIGAYDKSAVLFASDHGYLSSCQQKGTIQIEETEISPEKNYGQPWPPVRYHAFMMYKGVESRGKLKVSGARASLLDIMPTFCEVVFPEKYCKEKQFMGDSLESLSEAERERHVMLNKEYKPSREHYHDLEYYTKKIIVGDVRLEMTRLFKERERVALQVQ